MKAIVLSYDRDILLVDHLISTYQKLWPSHPFIFRVPYQEYPNFLKEKYQDKIELIYSPKEIKPTMNHLLKDIGDEEWIYWCMADRYLIDIKEKEVNAIYSWLQYTNEDISGILFCSSNSVYKKIESSPILIKEMKGKLFKLKEYLMENESPNQYWGRGIWMHQFLRAKVIKSLFNIFPDQDFVARKMDCYLQEAINTKPDKCQFNRWVYSKNLAIFGESLRRGKITINCKESLLEYGFEIPSEFEIYDKARIISGKLESHDNNKLISLKNKIKLLIPEKIKILIKKYFI